VIAIDAEGLAQRPVISDLLRQVTPVSRTVQRLAHLVNRYYDALFQGVLVATVVGVTVLVYRISVGSAINGKSALEIAGVVINIVGVAIGGVVNVLMAKQKERVQERFRKIFSRILNSGAAIHARIDFRQADRLFRQSLGELCGQNKGILKKILLDHGTNEWGATALRHTNRVSPPVLAEILHLLREPELDEPSKDTLLLWLCNVRIDSSSDLQSV
jgi:hypothetical protein